MSTLLLRLAGPMQSWGTQSRFSVRDTGREPSKSGVVGLLCAALGRAREETVDDLAALRMGVRVDREGSMRVDYHTAGGTHRRGESYGVAKADGSSPGTVTSRRYYLADADFLVGLEGEQELLARLDQALAEPVWQLSLGRKSFVPGVPIRVADGLRDGDGIEAALARYPWPRPGAEIPETERRPAQLRVVMEADAAMAGDVRQDQPVGAAFQHRRFAPRYTITTFLSLVSEVPIRKE